MRWAGDGFLDKFFRSAYTDGCAGGNTTHYQYNESVRWDFCWQAELVTGRRAGTGWWMPYWLHSSSGCRNPVAFGKSGQIIKREGGKRPLYR